MSIRVLLAWASEPQASWRARMLLRRSQGVWAGHLVDGRRPLGAVAAPAGTSDQVAGHQSRPARPRSADRHGGDRRDDPKPSNKRLVAQLDGELAAGHAKAA